MLIGTSTICREVKQSVARRQQQTGILCNRRTVTFNAGLYLYAWSSLLLQSLKFSLCADCFGLPTSPLRRPNQERNLDTVYVEKGFSSLNRFGAKRPMNEANLAYFYL